MADGRQGDLLRAWREHKELTLEAAAFGVETIAKRRGIDPKSKKIPRTHASLSRWETGRVEAKELGLELLAAVYGATVEELRRPPPPKNEPRRRTIEVNPEDASAVEAFIESLERRRRSEID